RAASRRARMGPRPTRRQPARASPISGPRPIPSRRLKPNPNPQRRGRAVPDFSLEREAGGMVAGVDEAGRGPWAGPVVAAAAILDPARLPRRLARKIDDSKKLTPAQRIEILDEMRPHARIAVA